MTTLGRSKFLPVPAFALVSDSIAPSIEALFFRLILSILERALSIYASTCQNKKVEIGGNIPRPASDPLRERMSLSPHPRTSAPQQSRIRILLPYIIVPMPTHHERIPRGQIGHARIPCTPMVPWPPSPEIAQGRRDVGLGLWGGEDLHKGIKVCYFCIEQR